MWNTSATPMANEELASELRSLYEGEGIPFSLDLAKNIVVVGHSCRKSLLNKGSFKMFRKAEEAIVYSAYMISSLSSKRLPDHLHNMMVLDISGSPFARRYMEASRG